MGNEKLREFRKGTRGSYVLERDFGPGTTKIAHKNRRKFCKVYIRNYRKPDGDRIGEAFRFSIIINI
jgi:hypothetical protein